MELDLTSQLNRPLSDLPPQVTLLNLSNNKLSSLDGLETCQHLVLLITQNNLLTTVQQIQPAFFNGILQIVLSCNQIESLSGLDIPHSLKILDLSSNKFNNPSQLQTVFMGRIEKLILDNNEFKPDVVGEFRNITINAYLKELSLSCTGIRDVNEFPSLFSEKNEVTKLNLNYNELRAIQFHPQCIIAELHLEDNKLGSVTDVQAAFNLQKLEYLNLSLNRLQNLRGIQGGSALKILTLENMNIGTVDDIADLAQMQKLQQLNIDGNPICEVEMYEYQVKEVIRQLISVDYILFDSTNENQ